MDVFDSLVDKYTNMIIDKHKNGDGDIYNKIELLIQNDNSYNSLDDLEKSIMLKILKDTPELKINVDNSPKTIVNIDKKVVNKKIWSVNKKDEGGKGVEGSKGVEEGKKDDGSKGVEGSDSKKKEIKKSAFDLSKLLSKKKYEPNECYNYNHKNNNNTNNATPNIPNNTNITGIIEPITDNDYENKKSIFTALSKIVLPAQRSEAWFKMRSEKITASDCGTVLGQNKHEPVYSFLLKKVFGSTFETNDACYHGKKFENIVTLMYEYKYDTTVHEFGLLGHPEHTILGASPDGICGPYKRDGKTRSELVGRMLEIKCPIFRKIKYSGEVKGEICPIYYWCQVQQQLECCNLDECDFVQVNIEEIDREEYLKDCKSDVEEYISKKTGLEKGALLEFIPTKISDDDIDIKTGSVKMSLVYDKASFVYPPKIDMSNNEIDKWVLTELDKKRDGVKLNRVMYWRILESSNTVILRDKAWFNDNLPRLKEVWSYVEFLRNNMSIANEWKGYIDSLPKKYSEKIMDKLHTLMKGHKQ